MTAPLPRDIAAAGPDGLAPLPSPDELAAQPSQARHERLDDLRGELYAVAAVIAEGAVRRAREQRSAYPPYGLVRSLFSQLKVVAADPRPYEEGSIASFQGLGQAFLDTAVFHLARELAAMRQSNRAWLLERLDHLLALYRIDAGKARSGRIRDPFSFVYGGLHFGTSMCVQLVEVMTRLLAPSGLSAEEMVAVLGRSSRALYQLAAVNIEDIPAVYEHVHGPSSSPWLRPDRFVVHLENGTPRRIDVVPPTLGPGPPGRYHTRGCPARGSAIATLWTWCGDLAVATGVIAGE